MGARRHSRGGAAATVVPPEPPVDAAEFSRLYRQHYDAAHRWATTLGATAAEAEDVVQDSFIIAYRRHDSFEEGRPFRPWLLGIVRRVLADRRRSSRRARAREQRQPELEPVPDLDVAIAAKQAHAFVQAFLDELPEGQRLVFALCELEELQTPEAAEVLGVPVKTIRSRLRQSRAKFAAAIESLRAREEQVGQ